MSQTLRDLETPCLIADRGRLVANARRMRDRAADKGVRLRPHVKTTKCAAIARLAHGDSGDEGPITVSTLKEAEYFFANGFRDITYAVAISENKFARAFALQDRGADLKVLVASVPAAMSLALATRARDEPLKVMLEIDCGEHRTGFDPQSADLLAAALAVHEASGLRLAGLLTHGGHSYGAKTAAEIAAVADQERECLLDAQRRLQDTGLPARILSSGSTPTAVFGENFAGIDEIRPGVYLAGDLFQAQLGVLQMEDIAVTVLATVIAHDIDRNRLVIDAGGLALSKDRSTAQSPRDFGYGLLLREDGRPLRVDAIVASVHQEHGEVTAEAGLPFDELPVGGLVRVAPNHVCMTAAGYERYFVTDGANTSIVASWEKTFGW